MATPTSDLHFIVIPSSSLIPHSMIIRVLNPNPYAHVRAIITTEELFRTNNVFASIYLDINNSFGCADQPYFEVYYPFAHATYGTYRYLYSEQSTMWSDLIASFNTFILGGRTISYTADRP
jgi:hypothetical protein